MSERLAFAFAGRLLLVQTDGEDIRVPSFGELAVLLGADSLDMAQAEVPLPQVNGRDCLAFDLPEGYEPSGEAALVGLRQLAGSVAGEVFSAAGTALQKVEWLRNHGFCSRCGNPTERHERHEALVCTECGHMHFARLSPAVIVLVERGREMLLGRSPGWPDGVYSTLAGFVDPGETLEAAVHREIMEEVRITVRNLRYFGSQPWPFPHSLMVGFVAEYEAGEIEPDPVEIEDARWFTPEDLPPRLPFKASIARALVDDFLARTAKTLLVLAALAAPASVNAQTSGTLPRVLELPASTRAMALGDAYMMNARHADALFYHPALLTEASGFGLEVQRWDTKSTATAMSAAMQWLGGGVGIGLLSLQYGAPGDGRDAAPAGQDHLFELGTTPVSERVAILGYAREVFGFSVGVAGKLVEERVGSARDAEAMVDLSVAREVGPITVGVTARDWGREPIVETGGASPSRLVVGVGAYGQQVGIFDVGISGALSYSEAQTVVSGGLEVGYWPIRGRTFVGRIGVQQSPDGSAAGPVSFGFAFWGDDVVVEWAYRPFGDLDTGTHRFGVRWR